MVLDKRKKPLMPCSEKRARLLLDRGRAVVHKRHPFTIRIKDRAGGDTQPVRLKIDPGSKATGMALVRVGPDGTEHVLSLYEIQHRGAQIRKKLDQRRGYRRARRSRLRYRAPRFDNRRRPDGWLPPSLQHRVDTTAAWVEKMRRLAPASGLAQELVRFDTQKLETPEISGVEYHQGTLAGYEVREYLLEKWRRACVYCDATGVPLQIEHIRAKARGGTDRVSNLALGCEPCNDAKGARDVREFLADDPERLQRILAHAKRPLRDAAAVNATRWALYRRLCATGLPVEAATGGRTKYNRARLGVPKTHALDAACVGDVAEVRGWHRPVLGISCAGRGAYQRTRLTRAGGVRGYLTRRKRHEGFATGDIVVAEVPSGKKAGTHAGRVAIRASGSFNVQTAAGTVQGIHHRHCRIVQRGDGYGYYHHPKPEGPLSLPTAEAGGISRQNR
jgi:5-methylcytosine-specific restriction endonuclease McrA